MNIALIRQKYTPFGGAERYMARLVEGLSAANHQVHILATEWEADGTEAVTLHKVPVIRKPSWLKAWSFSNGCRDIIDQENFDVVFSLERTLRQDIYRAGDGCHRQWMILKNLGGGLLQKTWTWLNPIQLAYIWLERRMFTDRNLKAIIANSQKGKEDIVRLYGVDPNRVHVVYNGVDPVSKNVELKVKHCKMLSNEFGLSNELRLLYVGSGFKRKGVATAIRAAARLSIPFKLFIVGKGRAASYHRLAERLGIDGDVIFTGPRKDVDMFYEGCDLFVFPTLYDPFSNATLEAMAHGLPVITTEFNGVAEIIQHGHNGFVVQNPLDDAAIFTCIQTLSNQTLRLCIAAKAAETASAFTMQRNIAETLDVISNVVQQKRTNIDCQPAISA